MADTYFEIDSSTADKHDGLHSRRVREKAYTGLRVRLLFDGSILQLRCLHSFRS